MTQPKRIWVHPKFATRLKSEAGGLDKSLIEWTKELAEVDDLKQYFKKDGKKRNSLFFNAP